MANVVKILVDAVDNASGPVGKIGGAFHGLGSAAGTAGGAVLKVGELAAGAALGGIALLGSQIAFGAKALATQQAVMAQTGAVIKSTGGAAKVTSAQVAALAETIKSYSGVDEVAVARGENMLLTFTNIRNAAGKGNDIFTQSTKVLADLSQAMGTDMSTEAIKLGKALNDPVKGVTALTKVGVTFTQQQKDQIAALVKSGDTMGAQKIILKELNTEFGGSAKAFGDSAAGASAKLGNAFEDVQKTLAGAVLPIAAQAMTAIAGIFNNPAVQEGVAKLGGVVAGILKPAFDALAPIVQTVMDLFVDGSKDVGVLRDDLNEMGMGPMADFIGKIQTIIPAVGAMAQGFLDFGGKIAATVVPVVLMIVDKLAGLYEVVVTKVAPAILDFAVRIWEGGLNKAFAVAGKVIGAVIQFLTDLFKAITGNKDIMNALQTAADLIGKAFGIAADFVSNLVDFLGNLGKTISGNKDAMNALALLGDAIGLAFKIAGGILDGVVSTIRTIIEIAQKAIDLVTHLGGVQTGAGAGPGANLPKGGGSVLGSGQYGRGGGATDTSPAGPTGAVNLNVNVSGAALFDPYGTGAQQIATSLLPGLRRALAVDGGKI